MRARGGTGEAIDLRTLVLVLRYLNQSHGEFVKNTKGSQSITYTDRKVRLAVYSSNESHNAFGPIAAYSRHSRRVVCNLAGTPVNACGMALQQCVLASCSCRAFFDITPQAELSISISRPLAL